MRMVLRLARDPQTSGALLAELSKHTERKVRREVCKNPNTPWPILQRLCAEHPDAFLKNPLVSLLSLEDPNLMHGLSSAAILGLLQLRRLPSWIRQSLVTHPDVNVRAELAWRLSFSPFLESFLQNKDERVRLAAIRNSNIPLRTLWSLSTSAEENMRVAVAEHPKATADLLMHLLRDSSERVRESAISNGRFPLEEFARVMSDPSEYVRSALARNRRTPPALLVKLASDESDSVRERVASHPGTPLSTLIHFGQDPCERVRLNVSWRMRFLRWDERMSVFALDESPHVRNGLANHPEVPVALLQKLARDPSEILRISVARHRATPSETIGALCDDRSPEVKEAALGHRRAPAEALQRYASDEAMRYEIAKNPNTPCSLLLELAKEDSLQSVVAANPSTPHSLLFEMAKDPSLQSTIVENPGAPIELLETLAVSPNKSALEAITFRRVPPILLRKIYQRGQLKSLHGLASNPDTPLDILRDLMRNPELANRLRENPALPAWHKKRLPKRRSLPTPLHYVHPLLLSYQPLQELMMRGHRLYSEHSNESDGETLLLKIGAETSREIVRVLSRHPNDAVRRAVASLIGKQSTGQAR